MQNRAILFIYIALTLLIAAPAHAAELHVPHASVKHDSISVRSSVTLSQEMIQEIRKGVGKEIVFYVDLFRAWDQWPDEFVKGIKISQQFKCDPLKSENKLTSIVGTRASIKRFSTCDELIQWSLVLRGVEIKDISALDAGEYYIKVTVESRLRELPPFVNLLLFFIKETEFELSQESPSFPLR